MLTIRLQRIGRRNDPAFRIVALEKTSGPKAGNYTDLLGTYNPRTKAITVAGDRVKYWMEHGAQLTPSVSNLLIKNNVIDGKLQNVLPKKTAPKKEVAAEAAPEAAPAPAAEPASVEAPAEVAPEETPVEAAPAEEPAPAVEEAPAAPAEEAPAPEAAPEEAPAE